MEKETKPQNLTPLTVSVESATVLLGVGESLIRKMIQEKKLPVLRLGRRILIPRSAIEEMVKKLC